MAGQWADHRYGDLYVKLIESAYPLPGAKELLASFAERGLAVWLATSAKPEELEQSLQALEADGRLAGIVSSGHVEESKPAPDTFELALERAGCRPDEVVVVGDTVWDVQAADAAGLRTVVVLNGDRPGRRSLQPRRAGRCRCGRRLPGLRGPPSVRISRGALSQPARARAEKLERGELVG